MGHLADSMNKITTIKVLEPILIRIMSIGVTVEFVSQRVFDSVLITSVLARRYNMWNNEDKGLTRYSSSLYIKGVMALLALVWLPAWPRTQTAAWPMPCWLMVPGMVQEEEGIE